MVDVNNTIEDHDVEFLMSWKHLNDDGTRKYPDKPEEQYIFSTDGALAHLLLNEIVFTNTNWYQKDWPEAAQETTVLCVNCSDTFVWACADAETILREEIESLYRLWSHDPAWGAAAWSIHKRKKLPQKPVLNQMTKSGWDMDWLMSCTKEDILTKYRRGPTEVD